MLKIIIIFIKIQNDIFDNLKYFKLKYLTRQIENNFVIFLTKVQEYFDKIIIS